MNKLDWKSHNWLAMLINNRSLRKNIHLIKGRVVDLGCGDCQYKEDILEVAEEYIGVDWEKTPHQSQQVDIFADLNGRLPFEDGFADTFLSFQVLEHLPEPLNFLKECHRILREKGALVLTVPFMWGIHEEPHDYYRYTRYGLKYLLEEAGFTGIRVEENTGFWQMWVLKFNYHVNRRCRGYSRIFWVIPWFLGQLASIALDMVDRDTTEAGSYTVTAFKV
ncbi:MAG: class I SAM-dependent methyltransferase [Deltaproteobacteria bacterium]|nr:class I SAM-dependent methyltransferase [Deltaproteobacteria bacterium]